MTSKPNEVALSILYSMLVKDAGLNFNPEVFSTIEAVVELFGKKIITEKELVEILDELKTAPDNVYTI